MNPVFGTLIMDRPRSAFQRANTKRICKGRGNHHKTPGKVFSFGVLTKQDFKDRFGQNSVCVLKG